MPFGYAGKIAFIDLSNRKTTLVDTVDYIDWIGGRGINQRILFSSVKPGTDPLGPENVLVFGAGPLVGSLVPTGCRLAVDFKNVVTGGLGSANGGGHFAAEMKFAGFDHLVITGRSTSPVYLFIKDRGVHFRDASGIWGQDTWQTELAIQNSEGDAGIRTVSIGPGGENQVKFACLIADRGRALGYGGSGAVCGSKNLKAIAVRGSMPLGVARPDELIAAVKRYNEEVSAKSEFVKIYREGGTLLGYQKPGQNRPHAVNNMADEFWSDSEIEKTGQDKFAHYEKAVRSCFGCPYFGSKIYEIEGHKCEGIQANSWRAFASNLNLTDPHQMLKMHARANLNGLDGDHTSSVMAWAVECYENGIIDRNDTHGLELGWGKGEALLELLHQIIHRQGFGDILAHGLREAAMIVGRGSEKLAFVSHGNALMESGMRSHRAWALGILTSTKGGGHLRGAPAVEFKWAGQADEGDVDDPAKSASSDSYQGKAAMVVWYERYKALIDMMGLCYLPSMWMDESLFVPDDIARFFTLVTGLELSPEELLMTGEKIQTSETVFNLLHAGFGRRDCLPPARLLREPVSRGVFKGQKIDLPQFSKMLDEYYGSRGWDPVTGWPTRQILEKLGLNNHIRAVEDAGLHLPSE